MNIGLILLIVIISYSLLFIPTLIKIIRIKKSASFNISEKLELPILSVYCGGEMLNLLVDTGSTDSHIRYQVAKDITDKDMIDVLYNCTCGNGELNNVSKVVELDIKVGKKIFRHPFIANKSIEGALNSLSAKYGNTVHGILGSKFLKEHRYIINYSSNRIYSCK